VRGSEFGGGTDPTRANDEDDLREHEVAQPELPLQAAAVTCDIFFGAIYFSGDRQESLLEPEIFEKRPFVNLALRMRVLRGFFRRRRLISKFAMTNLSAGVSDVATHAEDDSA